MSRDKRDPERAPAVAHHVVGLAPGKRGLVGVHGARAPGPSKLVSDIRRGVQPPLDTFEQMREVVHAIIDLSDDDHDRAAVVAKTVHERICGLERSPRYHKLRHGMNGISKQDVAMRLDAARGATLDLWLKTAMGATVPGDWILQRFNHGREVLMVLTGEQERSKEIDGLDRTTTEILETQAVGYAAAVTAPVVAALAVQEAPLLAWIGRKAIARVATAALGNPLVATEAAGAAVGIGLDVGEHGLPRVDDPSQIPFILAQLLGDYVSVRGAQQDWSRAGSRPRLAHGTDVAPEAVSRSNEAPAAAPPPRAADLDHTETSERGGKVVPFVKPSPAVIGDTVVKDGPPPQSPPPMPPQAELEKLGFPVKLRDSGEEWGDAGGSVYLPSQEPGWPVDRRWLERAEVVAVDAPDTKGHKNVTRVVTMRGHDGRTVRGIFKPQDGEHDGLRAGAGGDLYAREVASSRVNDSWGLDLVPPTAVKVVDGQVGSVQLFAEGSLPIRSVQAPLDTQGVELLRALDYVNGNWDRHNGNVMVRNVLGRLMPVGIDNGLTFPPGANTGWRLKNKLADNACQPISAETVAVIDSIDLGELSRELSQSGMPREAARHALRRALRLKQDPSFLGSGQGVIASTAALPEQGLQLADLQLVERILQDYYRPAGSTQGGS